MELCLRTELMDVRIIHPSIHLCAYSPYLGRSGSKPCKGGPSVLLFSHILQLFVKDAEEFPGQMGYVIPQTCSGWASPSTRTEYLHMKASYLDAWTADSLTRRKQRLYSELHPNVQMSGLSPCLWACPFRTTRNKTVLRRQCLLRMSSDQVNPSAQTQPRLCFCHQGALETPEEMRPVGSISSLKITSLNLF